MMTLCIELQGSVFKQQVSPLQVLNPIPLGNFLVQARLCLYLQGVL
jgi:hypothetical protein